MTPPSVTIAAAAARVPFVNQRSRSGAVTTGSALALLSTFWDCCRNALAETALQFGHKRLGERSGIARQCAVLTEIFYPAPDLIRRFKRQIDHVRRHCEAMFPDGLKDVLGRMQNPSQRQDFEKPGGAFQRMDGPEQAVNRILVVRCAFYNQQNIADLLQQLARFCNELLEQLGHTLPRPSKSAA